MGADYFQTLDEIDLDNMAGSPIVGIGKNTVIENAIIDKNARLEGVTVKPGNVPEGVFEIDGVPVVPRGFGTEEFRTDLYQR